MSENEKNVPKRRFKEFENADSWEQHKLGYVAIEIVAGGDIDKDKIVNSGKYPVLANALTNDGIVGYYEDDYRIKAPAVTVTGRGDVGHAKARNIDFTPVVRLLSVKTKHDVDFLEHAINNHEVLVESTGVPQLTVPQLSKYEIYFPKTDIEEKAIGVFFKILDNLITLNQRKLDKMKELKKAYLIEMFPAEGECKPKLRFVGFTDDWEQRKLDEIATMKARIGWQGLTQKEFLDKGDYYLITGTDFENGQIDFTNCHYINKERYSQDANIQVKNGDVLITKDGTIGKVAYIRDMEKPATLNAGVFVIKGKDKNISNLYLYHYLAAPFLLDYADKQATGGTIKHLNQNVLVNFPIPLPKIEEQQRIGEYFQNIDNLITLHQRKLDKLQDIKKAYLNEMFI
ncbi:hypothetical protein SH1V18_38290 [Vallitalea longa]|uniref:Type I restriction modification DNA specificity domain-containing protein n=1 Tax=Vallitalea longa TaxID=2936439 RepID=A0A9W5YE27_9FIRM|nr:restriction endonuclease subunit S [Vallitalea longa]GKX31349.1 hypothetical protein SH1V18_38290 [Vallitalea longa]